MRQSCLAAPERDIDDAPQGGHQAAFMERLAASIDLDTRLKPANLGYAADGPSPSFAGRATNYVTWDGVLYEG